MLRFLLTLVFTAAITLASDFAGVVTRVLDGDTLEVTDREYSVRLRLYGIDTPEKMQSGGREAADFLTELALGQTVTVLERAIDRYGRVVADVQLSDGRILNREMLRAGHAWWYARYAPLAVELRNLEAEARAQRKGLWSEWQPQPPWEWRREEHPVRARTGIHGDQNRVPSVVHGAEELSFDLRQLKEND